MKAILTRLGSGGHQEVIELTGHRNEKTHQFGLLAGTYIVKWRAHSDDDPGDCFFSGKVYSVAGSFNSDAGEGTVQTTGSGSTYMYNVPDGQFYFDAISGCSSWTVTISPQ